MRYLHIIPIALAILCLFGHSGLGAPALGRYMWLECNPSTSDANCVLKKGPLIPLNDQRSRLPPEAAKDIIAESSEEANVELQEQSGEASGDSDIFASVFSGKNHQKMTKFLELNEEEGSTFEKSSDYSEYVTVTPQKVALSKEDMTEDHILA
ncbi:hypothetical protein DNTS_002652 [Danionella cerebrum]|uniref:Serglycin n=1 Tax=Danionella cerebrum TaxID=2873325 RepID=A0A553QKM2_9TELE|nr:hypothetical protein DNTS_002652 [Danionella translucida]